MADENQNPQRKEYIEISKKMLDYIIHEGDSKQEKRKTFQMLSKLPSMEEIQEVKSKLENSSLSKSAFFTKNKIPADIADLMETIVGDIDSNIESITQNHHELIDDLSRNSYSLMDNPIVDLFDDKNVKNVDKLCNYLANENMLDKWNSIEYTLSNEKTEEKENSTEDEKEQENENDEKEKSSDTPDKDESQKDSKDEEVKEEDKHTQTNHSIDNINNDLKSIETSINNLISKYEKQTALLSQALNNLKVFFDKLVDKFKQKEPNKEEQETQLDNENTIVDETDVLLDQEYEIEKETPSQKTSIDLSSMSKEELEQLISDAQTQLKTFEEKEQETQEPEKQTIEEQEPEEQKIEEEPKKEYQENTPDLWEAYQDNNFPDEENPFKEVTQEPEKDEMTQLEEKLQILKEEEKDYIGAYFIPQELTDEIKEVESKISELKSKNSNEQKEEETQFVDVDRDNILSPEEQNEVLFDWYDNKEITQTDLEESQDIIKDSKNKDTKTQEQTQEESYDRNM